MKYLNLFVVALLLLASACKQKDGSDSKKQTETDPSDTIKVTEIKKDSSKSAPFVVAGKDTALANKAKPELATNNTNSSATNDVKVKNDNRYYLIVGSFKDFENSKKLSKKLEGSEIIDGQNSFQRVAKAAFDNKQEALKALKQYRKKHSKKAAWLLHQ